MHDKKPGGLDPDKKGSLSKRVRTYNGPTIREPLTVQKPRESQIELFDEKSNEQRQRCFDVACPMIGGSVRWNVDSYLRNVHETMAADPVRSKVSCKPISSKESRLHQFGKKVLPGTCVGCVRSWAPRSGTPVLSTNVFIILGANPVSLT